MPQPNRRQWISTAVLGLVMFAADYGCLFWAEKEVPSGLAAVIAATIPVWVLLAEWMSPARNRRAQRLWPASLLGSRGLFCLCFPQGFITLVSAYRRWSC